MTSRATFLLIFSPPGYGNTGKSRTDTGASGVADCDAALSDLPPQHWMRKASLFEARAIHHLEIGDVPSALTDLDNAETAAKDKTDPFYARSLALDIKFVRAFALRQQGDKAGSEALVMQTLAERPYNRQTTYTALTALGPDASPDNLKTVEQEIARIVPTEVAVLFGDAFESGNFAEAIALYPDLSPPEEIGDLNIADAERQERDWRNFETAETFWAAHGGGYAYALAATGKNAEARAALEAARAKLTQDTEPPPPLSAADARDSDTAALHQGLADIHTQARAEGNKILDEWTSMVERRIMVSEGKVKEVMATLKTEPLMHSWAAVDLLDSLVAAMPKSQRPPTSPTQQWRVQLAQERASQFKGGLDTIFTSLPEAETADRVPTYEEADKPFLAMTGSQADMDTNGYRIHQSADGSVTTIRFRGVRSTGSIVEEMALLCAADLARKSGKKGFVVLHRKDVTYSIDSMTYGTITRTDPDGFETTLDVAFVDPAAPGPYAGAPWRIIDADAVYNALAPIYIKPKKN